MKRIAFILVIALCGSTALALKRGGGEPGTTVGEVRATQSRSRRSWGNHPGYAALHGHVAEVVERIRRLDVPASARSHVAAHAYRQLEKAFATASAGSLPSVELSSGNSVESSSFGFHVYDGAGRGTFTSVSTRRLDRDRATVALEVFVLRGDATVRHRDELASSYLEFEKGKPPRPVGEIPQVR